MRDGMVSSGSFRNQWKSTFLTLLSIFAWNLRTVGRKRESEK